MTRLSRPLFTRPIPLPTAVLSLAALGCGLVIGCGGPTYHRLSGKVTFKGQPIPAGKIYFTPDGKKNNTGPTGYADITNGSYDTGAKGGQGMVGGPMVVRIEGFDPSAKPDEKAGPPGEITTKSLFPSYETTVELPRSSGTKDFDVPAEAADVKPGKPAGGVIVP